jgi:adenosylcobinamide-GDP ribazoletransferase
MKNFYLGFKFAFSYFSILPIAFKNSDNLADKQVLASMLLFLPFVGLVLGAVIVIFFLSVAHLGWYASLISAVLYMMLYGFIHTEAVIDVADAIYASHSGKDAYKIIKEPTVGAMGVLYAIGFVLLKVAGVIYLFNHHLLMEFIAILIISRLSILMLFKIHTFKSSFATLLKESLSYRYLIASFILFTLIGLVIVNKFIFLLLIGLLLAYLISLWIKSRIKFVNGDVLGATVESVEILLFFIASSFN